jgi:hypothetical protein
MKDFYFAVNLNGEGFLLYVNLNDEGFLLCGKFEVGLIMYISAFEW